MWPTTVFPHLKFQFRKVLVDTKPHTGGRQRFKTQWGHIPRSSMIRGLQGGCRAGRPTPRHRGAGREGPSHKSPAKPGIPGPAGEGRRVPGPQPLPSLPRLCWIPPGHRAISHTYHAPEPAQPLPVLLGTGSWVPWVRGLLLHWQDDNKQAGPCPPMVQRPSPGSPESVLPGYPSWRAAFPSSASPVSPAHFVS